MKLINQVNKILPTAFLGCILSYSGLAIAKDSKKPSKDHGEQHFDLPYGMAGCGLWSRVITSKERGAQLGVSVLRIVPYIGSIDSQISGITSGTSNCVATRADFAQAEGEVFVAINVNSLTKETAQGEGQHLSALAEILGCPHEEFARVSQKSYHEIFENQDSKQIWSNYLREIRSDESLHGQCTNVS